jgi:hypothetical protein
VACSCRTPRILLCVRTCIPLYWQIPIYLEIDGKRGRNCNERRAKYTTSVFTKFVSQDMLINGKYVMALKYQNWRLLLELLFFIFNILIYSYIIYVLFIINSIYFLFIINFIYFLLHICFLLFICILDIYFKFNLPPERAGVKIWTM